jgi:phenylacetate-coenzyme A ligase PaaK-like adenylate-forming protein
MNEYVERNVAGENNETLSPNLISFEEKEGMSIEEFEKINGAYERKVNPAINYLTRNIFVGNSGTLRFSEGEPQIKNLRAMNYIEGRQIKNRAISADDVSVYPSDVGEG